MASADAKLDEILKRLDRLDAIEEKIDSFNNRLNSFESKFEAKIAEFDKKLEKTAEIESVDALKAKILILETFQENYKKDMIMKESYDKRLNVLIHGVKEDVSNAWEKREETMAKFREFVREGLNIEDPDDIEIVDIHRLPQHTVMRQGRRFHRQIIVKLLTVSDKQSIFNSVKHLKHYNAKLKTEDRSQPYIYVSDHLPAKFQEQRKKLLPAYKNAKRLKHKTVWKAVDGEYCLFIHGTKIELP